MLLGYIQLTMRKRIPAKPIKHLRNCHLVRLAVNPKQKQEPKSKGKQCEIIQGWGRCGQTYVEANEGDKNEAGMCKRSKGAAEDE